jgi:1-deoxyxylulose-5-phosphate synthase
MNYAPLGASGLTISRLILGGSHIGNVVDYAAASLLVDQAIDAGVTTFYTSDVYSSGLAQEILGKALHHRRDDVVIINKIGYSPASPGLAPGSLRRALEASLVRLGTDYVDVCSLHLWDASTPIEDTLDALESFRREGKARHFGCSNFTPWQLYRALWASELTGRPMLRAYQLEYNLLNRFPEYEMLPACQSAGVGILVYNALAGNLLAGALDISSRSRLAGPARQGHVNDYENADSRDRGNRLQDLSEAIGRSAAELALGWVLSHPDVTGVLVGPNDPDEFRNMLGAVHTPLASDELESLNQIAVPGPPLAKSTNPSGIWHDGWRKSG